MEWWWTVVWKYVLYLCYHRVSIIIITVVDCGGLPAPSDGSITISETTFESVSVFSCNEGFNQSGSLMRQCQANGQWSGEEAVCTSMLNYIDMCTYISYHNWTYAKPLCFSFVLLSVYDCGPLNDPINGTVQFAQTTFGSLAVFTCDTGFNLTGNNGQDYRECLTGAEWSGEDPICESRMRNNLIMTHLLYLHYSCWLWPVTVSW